MASKLSLEILIRNESLFKYVILFSGYSYDEALYEKAKLSTTTRFPILAVHALQDSYVRPYGCCKPLDCCCAIYSETCFSVRDSFQAWARINRCDEKMTLALDVGYSYSFHTSSICYHAEPNCLASVTICELPHEKSHFFPLDDVAMSIFSQDYLETIATTLAPSSFINETAAPLAEGNPLGINKGLGLFIFSFVLFFIIRYCIPKVYFQLMAYRSSRLRHEFEAIPLTDLSVVVEPNNVSEEQCGEEEKIGT